MMKVGDTFSIEGRYRPRSLVRRLADWWYRRTPVLQVYETIDEVTATGLAFHPDAFSIVFPDRFDTLFRWLSREVRLLDVELTVCVVHPATYGNVLFTEDRYEGRGRSATVRVRMPPPYVAGCPS